MRGKNSGRILHRPALVHRLRLAALERLRGKYSDVYPPGYLEELRADWRE